MHSGAVLIKARIGQLPQSGAITAPSPVIVLLYNLRPERSTESSVQFSQAHRASGRLLPCPFGRCTGDHWIREMCPLLIHGGCIGEAALAGI